jgi:CRISPR-associated endonuclease Cas2
MFLIVNYDVQKPRGGKVMKYLRQQLHHIQGSVFVGEVTNKTHKEIRSKLDKMIKKDADRIIIFSITSVKALKIEVMGKQEWIENVI